MIRFLALLALAVAATAEAQTPAARLLAIHNRERALVGTPALVWDARLAEGAAAYARRLAARGRLEHSPPAERPGLGENLAAGTLGFYTPESLAELWVAEKSAFRNGIFPEVSRTGNWSSVGHYTQMIWLGTERVGCGAAQGRGNLFLVCRYAPAGNVFGRRSYGQP